MSMDLLERLLGHDHWTTRQFLELARSLSDQQLDRDFQFGHGTVRKTFEHVIWNVECWTDLMSGASVRNRPESLQSISDLLKRFDSAATRLAQVAHQVLASQRLNEHFLDSLETPPRKKCFATTFVHLATHGMHHRSQLLIMFRQLGVTDLPEGDAFSWESEVEA